MPWKQTMSLPGIWAVIFCWRHEPMTSKKGPQISLFMQNAKDYLIFAFTYNSFEAINPRLKFINTNVLEKMIWPGPNLFFLDCKM